MKYLVKNLMPKVFSVLLIVSIIVPMPLVTVSAQEIVADIASIAAENAPVVAVTVDNAPAADNAPTTPVVIAENAPVDPAVVVAENAPITPVVGAENAPTNTGGGTNPSVCDRVDFNNDGVINTVDFNAFEVAFAGGNMDADFDQSGLLNILDFNAFLNAYAECSNHSTNGDVCIELDLNNDGVLTTADFAEFRTLFAAQDMRVDFNDDNTLNILDFTAYINAYAECQGTTFPICTLVDINHDGVSDEADFTEFESLFAAQDMRADFDQNGTLNIQDFSAFMNAYAECTSTNSGTPAGITVSPTTGTTSEDGDSFSFTVSLNTVPSAPVTIALTNSDDTEGTLSTNSITFDASTTAQTVTVVGMDDPTLDGDIAYTITLHAATSTDANYDGIDAEDVSLVNIDNEVGPPTNNGGNTGGNGGGGSGGGSFSSSGGGSGFGTVGGEVLGATTAACNYLNSYIKRGANNDMVDVIKLQAFLNVSEGANLPVSGNFDDATFAAVSAFQRKYGNDILTPWGYETNESTGYVYILTKKKVNEMYCQTAFPLTTVQISEINDFKATKRTLAVAR